MTDQRPDDPATPDRSPRIREIDVSIDSLTEAIDNFTLGGVTAHPADRESAA